MSVFRFRKHGARDNHERQHRGIKVKCLRECFLKFFLLQEFHCHLCPKEFMQKRQLSVHIKRHLGQKVLRMEKIYSANF